MKLNRYWFLTSTTYGSWLPGDERGSVTRIRKGLGARFEHDHVYEPFDGPIPALESSARSQLKGEEVRFNLEQAQALLDQFQETCRIRGWLLIGVAIMANHVHWLLGVNGDPDPEDLLRDLKGYGSGRLNRVWTKPESGTWWTRGGSKRKLRSEAAIPERVEYLRTQPFALLIWIHPDYDLPFVTGEI